MSSIPSLIVPGAKIVRNYAERLVKDIAPEKFARTPDVGGVRVLINHPAFSLGHLALYPARLAPFLKLEVEPFKVPSGYEELFKDGTPCVDDISGDVYPPKDDLVKVFLNKYDELFGRLGDVPDSVFFAPMEDPKRRERFPTIGSFAAYLLSAHMNGHLGQVSAWRRCVGMGPA